MNEKPFVVEVDMGCLKPSKFAIFWPLPVYKTRRGKLYNIHPRQRFRTKEAAEMMMELLLPGYLAAAN